ncbi:hypothetical protein WR25_20776 isoform E [Diploscapter pachys]|uniref:MTOR-associated protein MEAK7 n=1 Tax=Diploscapter pachys TaxID=2018661 RepID=A0A2A2KDU6_9BILA|nr:hypothetical protein WR25_20776 isoform A [Diploscapter pachys]PAV72087.1 hypothetical protein WR25_20776 isoform E [Diploscapter pachys]
MGANQSGNSKIKADFMLVDLSSAQIEHAEQKLKSIASGKPYLDKVTFEKTYQSTMGILTSKIYDKLKENDKGNKERVQITKILCLADRIHGTSSSLVEALLALFADFNTALREVIHSFGLSNSLSEWEQQAFLDYVNAEPPKDPKDQRTCTNFVDRTQLIAAVARSVFAPLVFVQVKPLEPTLNGGESQLLPKASLIAINSKLLYKYQDEWTLLFSSILHGSSFSTMVKRIDGEGRCVVVVESAKGNVFGCYASEGFESGPRYKGTAMSFLFQARPQINVFFPKHDQGKYAYLNFQQETMPNGLGMGGSGEIWPFFMREDYGSGTCQKNCTSFEPCWIAGEANFQIK